MLKINVKLVVKSKVVMKCDKHPRYNPEKDGLGGVVGNCHKCLDLFGVHKFHMQMINAVRSYQEVAGPHEIKRVPKMAKAVGN